MPINSIAVFGPGLLGGSLLHDARRLGFHDIRACTRREEVAGRLRRENLADLVSTHVAEVATGAEFLVLAAPVGACVKLAEEIATCPLAPNALVTDVGSVKQPVLDSVGRIFQERGISFIGSHPMAGSEVKGLAAAQPGLFQKAACILTPEAHTNPADLVRLREFWNLLGCEVTEMEAGRHDSVVARISHMPHVAAVAVTLAALGADPTIARFAAGGLRDTTRVASGDPDMWEEILLENRQAVLAATQDLHQSLGELLEMFKKVAHQPLQSALREAKRLRETRYPSTNENPS